MSKLYKYIKNNRIAFIFFMLFIIMLLFIYQHFSSKTKDEYLSTSLDTYNVILNDRLKNEEMDALTIALLIAKNRAISDALKHMDEERGYELLVDATTGLKKQTSRYVKAQIITGDKNIFARSWDNIYAGMPLGDYREDLDYFKTNKNPRVSIEVGRRIGIKATVPIYDNDKLIGFVEVIDFFESMTDYFSHMGIDLYVMMDSSYLDVAILMQNNLMIDNMIVSNINYNPNNIQLLKNINMENLKSEKIRKVGDNYITYETMRDGELENIGAFVMVIPKEHLNYLGGKDKDISFLLNITKSGLYNISKAKQYEAKTPYNDGKYKKCSG